MEETGFCLFYENIRRRNLEIMKKILFFQWHSFMNKGMERALQKLEIPYDTFFYHFEDWEHDDRFLELFRKKIKECAYTDVLSVNFSPLVSQICEEVAIPYTAWVYDSPIHIRDTKCLFRSCNRLFFFDRGQAEEYQKAGVCAYHMPLAVDTDVFHMNVSRKEREIYKTDVSLVGKVYQTEYAYFTAPLTDYIKGYLEGIVNAQMKVYGGYLIPELVTQELLDHMNGEYAKVATDGFQMGRQELEFMLACETTGRERYMALALLSGHYNVDLYSTDKETRLPKVHMKGYADYYTQMPLVFSQSKINLNISLKTIKTGIPLRVTDVMGCGGFVLSNYQQELEEYFVIGEECVVYENLQDMFIKAKYYLEHEEERKRIAMAGLERVKRDFTFENRLHRMFNEV